MANGKGSGRRPAAVDDAKVASEWDRIFGQPDVTWKVALFGTEPATGHYEKGPYPLQRPAQRPLTTDLGSEFIRSIHAIASGASEPEDEEDGPTEPPEQDYEPGEPTWEHNYGWDDVAPGAEEQ